MADDKIVIAIEFDDGTVKKGFLNIEKQASDSSKKIKGSLSGVDSGLNNTKKAALALVGAFAGLAAVNKAINFFKDSISKAAADQDSIQKLNTALALTGKFSEQASQSIQNFANQLQNTTKFGNETTLEVASLIQNLGRLDTEGLQRATKAALDLSTALGIDVNSAATLVGKAANGNVEAFSRYGIKIQKAATDSETFAKTLAVLESRFGGASEAASKTFSGSITRLNNILGDFQETIGNTVLNSPSLIKVINLIGDAFINLSEAITKLSSGKDVFKPILIDAVNFAGSLTFLIQGAATLVSGLIISVGAGLTSLFQNIISGIVGGASRLVDLVSPSSDLANNLRTISADFANSSKQNFDIAGQALSDAFTLDSAEGTTLFFDNLKLKIEGATAASKDFKNNVIPPPEEISAKLITLDEVFSSFFNNIKIKTESLDALLKKTFQDSAVTALKGFGTASGQAFAAFGRAIAKGENGLKAFADAFLATIGQTAIQVGTNFILTGIGYSVLGDPRGPGLISAGAALATFGGVLSAVGGGVSSATGGAVSPESSLPGGGPVVDIPDQEDRKPTTQVSVNISGDVLDSRDTGLRIVDLIKEYTDRNGRTEVLA
jgi:hypothetical protein